MSVLDPTSLPTENNPAQIHQDERWMSHALDLARKSVGLASPNPAVGCVLVKNGAGARPGVS